MTTVSRDASPPPPAQPRRRKPTGRPGWPRILLSGPEGSWKSGTAAMLSAHPALGLMFWLEVGLGEQTADEYGRLPGVNYEIIDHNGRWDDMLGQLDAHWRLAKAAEESNEPPHPLAVDSMTAIDQMLKEMGDDRSRRREAAKIAKRSGNTSIPWSADYDAQMSPDLWNLIRKRHRNFMRYVLTWPGPVVLTARERMATVFDGEKPTGQKDWTLEARKDLPFDVTAWFRLHGHGRAEVMKLRSVAAPQYAKELEAPAPRIGDLNLGTVVFDWIGCEAGTSRAPRTIVPDADVDMPDEVDEIGAPEHDGGRDVPRGPRPASTPRGDGRPPQQRPEPSRIPDDELRDTAIKGVTLILGARSAGEAAANREHARKSKAAGYDVLGLLDGRDVTLENLGLAGRNKVFLAKLGAEVAAYWEQHGRSPVPEDVAERDAA
ncbi:hypothetical protein [Pseudonocardia sp. NPDC049635]|uniref:hypothetical protein n=1 Tax=Pseudonocardia sp. NPDC049635 TaxID=3155506 RepID=UPI00340D9963